jgi:Glycosyltransferase family 87
MHMNATPTGISNPRRYNRFLELFFCTVIVPVLLLAVLWIPLRAAGLGASADFIQFYAAGRIVASGQGAKLYDANVQSDIQRQVAPNVESILFNHPPFEALFYAPLAHFRYPIAFAIWTCLNLSLLGLGFFLLRDYGPPFGLAERLLLLAAAFYPVLAVVIQGQDSLWILLAYLVAFLVLSRGRDFPAGMLLGFALIKPQLVLPFAFLVMLRGRWRFMAGLVSSAVILTLISIVIAGPSVIIRYPRMLLQMNDPGHVATFHLFPETMPNLRGLLTVLLGSAAPPSALNLSIGILSIALLIWAGRQLAWKRAFELSFALALVTTLLVSFHLLVHDLSLLILPMFLLLSHLNVYERKWTRSKILRVAPLALLFTVFFVMQLFGRRDFGMAAIAPLVLAMSLSATLRSNSVVQL